MKGEFEIKDITPITNKISNIKLREKFKQRAIENNQVFP